MVNQAPATKADIERIEASLTTSFARYAKFWKRSSHCREKVI